ncbi:hypothetical protein NB311A_17569 [Nitrobacter sp. Nb-311A]|uniref:hypothetical protein n=1 Tax=Nitrobacter sp. Nb-311A TaxID=314253 RepID=UPI0000687356|nr:hypothetical protein [Nitrobacter sp. Nb-311A]EAQ35608.1 hypothetical protein NB311A_17569 [Nitrobacter sp. Nb-311A]
MSRSKRIQATAAEPNQPPRVLTAREQRILDILDTLSEQEIGQIIDALKTSLAIIYAGPPTQH